MAEEKKRKHDDSNIGLDGTKLKNFKLINIINENAQQKSIFLHGRFEGEDDTQNAVIILEKTQFDRETVSNLVAQNNGADLMLENDIYRTYQVYPSKEFSGVKTTLIYPATDKHIAKYTSQRLHVIEETAEDYQNIVLPYIESSAFSTQWVYNILEKKTESDRIVFEDSDLVTGFILLPDMKWDRNQVSDLYLVALVHDRSVKSLRDLNENHLPLLENIRDKGTAAILEKFGLSKTDLRVYVHYHPSYYHFHVHFTNVAYDAPGSGSGKAHLLNDIIDNIRICSDFYQRKSITYFLRENEALYDRFKESACLPWIRTPLEKCLLIKTKHSLKLKKY